MKKKKKRRLDNCLLFYPEFPEPMCCSFPEEDECGKYSKIIHGKKGLKANISLCKYRCKKIGRRECIMEQLNIKSWKR